MSVWIHVSNIQCCIPSEEIIKWSVYILNDVVIKGDLGIFCKICLPMCTSCDVKCINKVIESLTVLNKGAVVFAVTVEDLQIWWKSVCTR